MDSDKEKPRKERSTSSSEKSDESEDFMALFDEPSADDEGTQGVDETEDELSFGESEEDLIDLSDLVEEPSEEGAAEDTTLDWGVEDSLSLEPEGEEEEGILELLDEGEEEPESADDGALDLTDLVEEPSEEGAAEDTSLDWMSEDTLSLEAEGEEEEGILELLDEGEEEPESAEEDIIELTDLAETPEVAAEEEETLDLSGVGLGAEESDEYSLEEDLGLEMPEEVPGVSVEEEPGEPMEPSAPVAEEGPRPEAAVQPTDEALESVVAERLSDERIEEVIARVAKETIEKKADRILLEVAEAAIAKEIEKIKQAL